MKRIIIIFSLLLISLVLVNCSNNKKEIDYVVFSGTINGSNIDSLAIYDKDFKRIQTFHISKELTFGDTLFIPKGYYYIGDFKTIPEKLFLNPSYNIYSIIKSNDKDFDISFKGTGSNENNYLQQKIQYDKNLKEVLSYKYYMNLNEESFLKLVDSVNTEKVALLKSQENLDTDFLMFETFAVEYDKASLLHSYNQEHGNFINQPDFKVSKNYPNPYENIDFSDEKLLAHPNFGWSLHGYIFFKMNNDGADKQNSFVKLETIDKEFKNQKIKDKVAYESIKGQPKAIVMDDVYSKYMSMVENEDYRKEIEEKYSRLKKIAKGIISPSFELYDLNDDLVTLESLRGKLVYIDVWATWCIPCVQEIPALKVVEEEFRNKEIYFVSMCLKDSKEQFERFVKEKELGGIQLFAPDENIPFIKEYLVRESGIPRFILVDKEGKIIDAHAYKPSDIRLKDLLLENL